MRSLPVLLIAACAATPPPSRGGPRGMRATDHLDMARDHDQAARDASRWPERTSTEPGATDMPPPVPWRRTWNTADEHERLARIHRGEATALHAAYEEACGTADASRVAVSPLVRYRTGAVTTAAGAIVYLGPEAGGPDRLMSELRCHRAWMMLAPAGMDDCPLDLPGLLVDAKGDANGVTLTLSVADPKLIPELQRRLAVEAETKRSRL